MKRRIIVALCLCRGCRGRDRGGDMGATKKTTASSITVWLQVDAQSGWPKVVAAANKTFEQQNPGVTVNVQYQQWNTHLQKFDATLAGGNAPDVIEMGNSEMTKYMAAGAFADLTADKSHVPELLDLAQGPPGLGDVRRQADGRAVLRGLARRRLPQRTCSSRPGSRSRRRASRSSSPTARSSVPRTAPTRRSRRSTSPARTGTPRSASSTTSAGRSRRSPSGKWTGTLDTAAGDRGPERVQEHVPRALEGEQVDRRGQPVPDHAVLAGPCRVVRRPRLAVRLRARPEGRQPEAEAGHGRVPDAEPHARQDDARLPRRLGPRDPGRERRTSRSPSSGSPTSRATPARPAS